MKTEMQNCLSEATSYAGTLSCDPTGAGDYRVKIMAPYYCRSTDAFAGSFSIEDRSFETREAAESFITDYFADDQMDELSADRSYPRLPSLPDITPQSALIQDLPF